MGCCSPTDNNLQDLPFTKIGEFNNLKTEIDQILSDKYNKDRKNASKLFELFDKTSNTLTEYQRELTKLKNRQLRNKTINDNMIQVLQNDINQLKEYTHTLNDLLKETDDNEPVKKKKYEFENEKDIKNEIEKDFEKDIIKEEINFSNKIDNNDVYNFLNDDFKNGFKNYFQNESENDFNFNDKNEIITTQNELENVFNNNNDNNYDINNLINNKINNNIFNNFNNENIDNASNEEKIYFKKYIRRNKKSQILNRNKKSFKDNINENENEIIEKNENFLMDDEDNLINLMFSLENGEKIEIQMPKNGSLKEVLEKLGEEKEEYNDIQKIQLFDGNDEITDKVKNGEIVSNFGFNDYHIIQLKLKND